MVKLIVLFIPVHEGKHLASKIPGAKLKTFPGLNHDFPSELVPCFVEEIHFFINELVNDKQNNNNNNKQFIWQKINEFSLFNLLFFVKS